jgi:hypothetical protein
MSKTKMNIEKVALRILKMKANVAGKENEELLLAKLVLNVNEETPVEQIDEKYLHLSKLLDKQE